MQNTASGALHSIGRSGLVRKTRELRLGSARLGGDNPVLVQSMTNTDTRQVEPTVAQIAALMAAGCGAVRVAVPSDAAAAVLPAIRAQVATPLIGDVHFDYHLAIAALEAGFEGLRINPGNIGGRDKVDKVVDAAKAHKAIIRVGVNAGSLEKDLLALHGPTPEAMVKSAMRHVRMLEERAFTDIKISLKSSSVLDTITAYTMLSQCCEYPLHIGVTEAGTLLRGAIKSAVGLGVLLYQGIGDTLRVSLTHDPIREVEVAYAILASLGLGSRGVEIISCPTCGRTEIDLIGLAEAVEQELAGETRCCTVAVMGCVVNGPGEAKEADVGIAGGRGKAVLFRKGEVVRTVYGGKEDFLQALMEEIAVFWREMDDK